MRAHFVVSRLGIIAAVLLTLLPSSAFAANCCAVNGSTCNIIPPLTHGQNGWTGSICGTTLSGTNCTALLDTGASVAAGDCLTLGKGVTLDLAGFNLECTSSSCGSAIKNTDSGGASSAVQIKNGNIVGAWAFGVTSTGGTNSSVSDLVVDGSDIGISNIRGLIERVVVRNSASIGINLKAGEDLKNSIVRDSGGYGLFLDGNFAATDLDNILLTGNYHSVGKINYGSGPTLTRSDLQQSTGCHCINHASGSCINVVGCMVVPNSTTVTFVDDTIIP